MKTLKILLVEDNFEMALAIKRILRNMISSISQIFGEELECYFIESKTFDNAKMRIRTGGFSIIYLGGNIEENISTIPLIFRIKDYNPSAVFFFASENPSLVKKVKERFFLDLSFLKKTNPEKLYGDIISEEEVALVKEKILAKLFG